MKIPSGSSSGRPKIGWVGLAVVLGELLPLSALMMSPRISPTTENWLLTTKNAEPEC